MTKIGNVITYKVLEPMDLVLFLHEQNILCHAHFAAIHGIPRRALAGLYELTDAERSKVYTDVSITTIDERGVPRMRHYARVSVFARIYRGNDS